MEKIENGEQKPTLKDYIESKILEGYTRGRIAKMAIEDGIDVSGKKDLVKYCDNVRQGMKSRRPEGTPEGGSESAVSEELSAFIENEYERLKISGVIGKNAIGKIKKAIKERMDETLDSPDIVYVLKKALGRKTAALRRQGAIDEMNRNIDDVRKYDVKNGNYEFKIRKTNRFGEEYFVDISVPVTLVDGLFYDFSRHGANMSSDEVIRKYRFKPEVFQALKSRLWLYKSSNVISPFTLENSTEEELDTVIGDGVNRHIRDKYKEKFVKTYEKAFETRAKKAMKIAANVEDVIGMVREGISEMEPLLVNRERIEKLNRNPEVAIFVSSDYHFGESDDAILCARLDEMVDEMISAPERNIHWISLGDLGETFLDEGMHPGRTARMKLRGFDLVKYIYRTFASRMLRVIESGKTLHVEWRGGNHDRTGKTNDMDRARTWAIVIGEMIELALKNYAERGYLTFTNHRGPTIRKMIGKLGIIANHGDGPWHKIGNAEILAKYGFGADVYHLILEGDKHHFIAKRDTNSIKVVTSSVKKGWEFADNVIHKSSEPGFLRISETKNGKARITMAMFSR